MSKIITITFSPCIDKSATVTTLLPEKKMHCTVPKTEPGGGGINVARVLRMLGSTVTAVFPSGGCTGTHLAQLLQTKKPPFITIPSKNETRENFVIFDESTKKTISFWNADQ